MRPSPSSASVTIQPVDLMTFPFPRLPQAHGGSENPRLTLRSAMRRAPLAASTEDVMGSPKTLAGKVAIVTGASRGIGKGIEAD